MVSAFQAAKKNFGRNQNPITLSRALIISRMDELPSRPTQEPRRKARRGFHDLFVGRLSVFLIGVGVFSMSMGIVTLVISLHSTCTYQGNRTKRDESRQAYMPSYYYDYYMGEPEEAQQDNFDQEETTTATPPLHQNDMRDEAMSDDVSYDYDWGEISTTQPPYQYNSEEETTAMSEYDGWGDSQRFNWGTPSQTLAATTDLYYNSYNYDDLPEDGWGAKLKKLIYYKRGETSTVTPYEDTTTSPDYDYWRQTTSAFYGEMTSVPTQYYYDGEMTSVPPQYYYDGEMASVPPQYYYDGEMTSVPPQYNYDEWNGWGTTPSSYYYDYGAMEQDSMSPSYQERSCQYYHSYMSPGIWAGMMFIVSGVIGLLSAERKTTCFIVSLMVMSVVTAFIAIASMLLSIWAQFDIAWNQVNPMPVYMRVANGLVSLTALVAFIISWFGFGFACRAVCCNGPNGYPKIKKQQYQYRPLPNSVASPVNYAQTEPSVNNPDLCSVPIILSHPAASRFNIPEPIYLVQGRQVIGVLPQNPQLPVMNYNAVAVAPLGTKDTAMVV